jgi:hypothetical protein
MISVLLFVLAQLTTIPTAHEAVERLRAKTPVDLVANASLAQLAGKYTTTSTELRKLVGPFLHGDDLYLFPDGTYIYCEWTDIEPVTVYDKGTWSVAEGLIELKSDPEVTWDPGEYRWYDRRYVPVRRSSRNNEVLLVGVEYALPYFEKKAGEDPAFMLLINAKKRETTLSKARTATLKSRLLKESWRPEYFKQEAK